MQGSISVNIEPVTSKADRWSDWIYPEGYVDVTVSLGNYGETIFRSRIPDDDDLIRGILETGISLAVSLLGIRKPRPENWDDDTTDETGVEKEEA